MGSLQRHERHHSRSAYPPILLMVGFFIVAAICIWLLFFQTSSDFRQTMVIVSSPMTVISWDPAESDLTIITIPSDVVAEGTHGYGNYSLEAFWKLGEIDKKDGSVLAESLSESLGIPVDWYIGPKTGVFAPVADPLTAVKDVFSFGNIFRTMGGHYRTNIPLGDFIHMVWDLQVGRPAHIKTLDFSRSADAIAQDTVLPDGSHQMMLDSQRLDVRLKSIFEDARARGEAITVAVYNTTAMPSLGNRVARLLGHLGISVVTVGNDSHQVDGCTVSGQHAALKSVSAQLITAVLKCKDQETSESDRADLIVRMGSVYKKRFLPN